MPQERRSLRSQCPDMTEALSRFINQATREFLHIRVSKDSIRNYHSIRQSSRIPRSGQIQTGQLCHQPARNNKTALSIL